MKKDFIKGKGAICLLAAVLAIGAVGCGVKETGIAKNNPVQAVPLLSNTGGQESISAERFQEPESVSEGRRHSSMGSVPYFRDDAGRRTQTAGGYLYGYWNNRLCRYDPETLEETVLYEAASSQHGDFCIWGDYIYFMVIPKVTAIGSLHGSLYRVKCDGSEEAVCLASVRMPEQVNGGQYYEFFKLDTYEDVLYLIKEYDDEDNLYFRLNRDGSIVRISESETLYGKLPEGYSARGPRSIWNYNSDNLITLPYAMRNYGYVFAEDEDRNPVRIDLDSQKVESLDAIKDYSIRAVTNDAVILVRSGVWYRASLDDINEITEISEIPETSSYAAWFAAWDQEGLYFRSADKGIFFVDWEGEKTVLREGLIRSMYSPMDYFGEDFYYYVAEEKGDKVVIRLGLTGDDTPEQVAVYRSDPSWDIITSESYDCNWTDDHTGVRVEYGITEIRFKEDAGAFGRINDFLDGLYEQDMEYVEKYKEALNTEFDWEDAEQWGAEYVQYSDDYWVCYLDEDYVGIAACWYEYWKGAAHGMHGTIYYMFDRHTGERVFITDVVDNSAEEICEIIAPYVEAAASWGTDEEGWEAMLLEENRFFLSEEGIGIHFDVYEVDCYAAGDQEIIVPYRAFDLR